MSKKLRVVHHRQVFRPLSHPRRLEVWTQFCQLGPDAQAVVADLTGWLHRDNPRNRRSLERSLDALSRRHMVRAAWGAR